MHNNNVRLRVDCFDCDFLVFRKDTPTRNILFYVRLLTATDYSVKNVLRHRTDSATHIVLYR